MKDNTRGSGDSRRVEVVLDNQMFSCLYSSLSHTCPFLF